MSELAKYVPLHLVSDFERFIENKTEPLDKLASEFLYGPEVNNNKEISDEKKLLTDKKQKERNPTIDEFLDNILNEKFNFDFKKVKEVGMYNAVMKGGAEVYVVFAMVSNFEEKVPFKSKDIAYKMLSKLSIKMTKERKE